MDMNRKIIESNKMGYTSSLASGIASAATIQTYPNEKRADGRGLSKLKRKVTS